MRSKKEANSDGVFLIKLAPGEQGIGKIDFSNTTEDDIENLKKELTAELKEKHKSDLYKKGIKDLMQQIEDHESKNANILEILKNGKVRVPEHKNAEFRIEQESF